MPSSSPRPATRSSPPSCPSPTVVTPNLPEAEVLCGFSITDREGMRRAARAIHARGPRCVVVKGGHLQDTDFSTDLFYDGERFEELSAARIDTRNTHGTGCTFASAIAARLALGDEMLDGRARRQALRQRYPRRIVRTQDRARTRPHESHGDFSCLSLP